MPKSKLKIKMQKIVEFKLKMKLKDIVVFNQDLQGGAEEGEGNRRRNDAVVCLVENCPGQVNDWWKRGPGPRGVTGGNRAPVDKVIGGDGPGIAAEGAVLKVLSPRNPRDLFLDMSLALIPGGGEGTGGVSVQVEIVNELARTLVYQSSQGGECSLPVVVDGCFLMFLNFDLPRVWGQSRKYHPTGTSSCGKAKQRR